MRLVLAMSALALVASRPAAAVELSLPGELGQLQVHGFISQGFLLTSANNYLAHSSRGSFEFTELGLNFTMLATDKLTLRLQLFSHHLLPIRGTRLSGLPVTAGARVGAPPGPPASSCPSGSTTTAATSIPHAPPSFFPNRSIPPRTGTSCSRRPASSFTGIGAWVQRAGSTTGSMEARSSSTSDPSPGVLSLPSI